MPIKFTFRFSQTLGWLTERLSDAEHKSERNRSIPAYSLLFFCIYILRFSKLQRPPLFTSSTWFKYSQICQFISHLFFHFFKVVTIHRVKKIVDSQKVKKLHTIRSGKHWLVDHFNFSSWLKFLIHSLNPKFFYPSKCLALNASILDTNVFSLYCLGLGFYVVM